MSASDAHEPSHTATTRAGAGGAGAGAGAGAAALGRSVLGLTQPTYKVGPPTLDELPAELREKYETHRNRKAHPLFQTQSMTYGSVPRGVDHKVVNPVAGKQGGFSATFTAGGATRSQSLITSVRLRCESGAC